MIGWAALLSAATSRAPNTNAVPMRPKMGPESQAYCRPPHEVTRTIAVTLTVIVTLPRMSSLGRSCLREDVLRKAAAVATAKTPNGRLNQKAQRQPMVSVNQPPSRGPSTDATAKQPPMMPM